MITLIAAMDDYRGIGIEGTIPWRQRNDMQRFKALTYGHTVVMGRKTYDTFPKGGLTGRRHLVLTRDLNSVESTDNVVAYDSIDGLVADEWYTGDVFVIGGGEVYQLFMPLADRLILTRVRTNSKTCDAHFPEFGLTEWRNIANEDYPNDNHNQYCYSFETYVRRK